jgi:hypothetical protein
MIIGQLPRFTPPEKVKAVSLISRASTHQGKLATTTQPQLRRNVTDFEQETNSPIRMRTLMKLLFDQLLTSSQVGVFIRLKT